MIDPDLIRQVEKELKKPDAPVRPQDYRRLTETETIEVIARFLVRLCEVSENKHERLISLLTRMDEGMKTFNPDKITRTVDLTTL